MFKKFISIGLAGLLLNFAVTFPVYAKSREENSRFATRVKQAIAKLGTGREALVEVKLRDNSRLAGYVSEATDDSFRIVNSENDSVTTVTYPQVKRVKGHNLAAGVKIAIGVAAVIGVIFLVAALTIPKT